MHRIDLRLLGAALAATLVTSLTGCGGSTSANPDGGDETLTGSWVLRRGQTESGELPRIPRHRVTFYADGTSLTGTAGCNGYEATGSLTATTIDITEMRLTEMACGPAAMDLERRFVAALMKADTVRTGAFSLTLVGPGVRLDFREGSDPEDLPLVGTLWELDSLVDGYHVTSLLGPATLVFDRGTGVVRGSTACREFEARFTRDRTGFELLGLSESLRGGRELATCTTAARRQHEQIVEILNYWAIFADIDGATLTVQGEHARQLVYLGIPPRSGEPR